MNRATAVILLYFVVHVAHALWTGGWPVRA